MRITFTITKDLKDELEKYIQDRFGPGKHNVKSAIIQAAIRHYLYPNTGHKETESLAPHK